MDVQANSQGVDAIPTDPSKLAKFGISLLINNRVTEAEELFRTHQETIQMCAGYAFVLFMDALMSFEEEKLTIALDCLREVEKKCAANIGWIKSVKSRVLGRKTLNIANRLETQIILADTQVCVALITFLQQEFSGYLRGGWVLRKASKVYYHTYIEIMELYKQKIGPFNLPEPTDFEWSDNSTDLRKSNVPTTDSPEDPEEWVFPDPNSSSQSRRSSRNGYVPISAPVHKPNMPHSQSTYLFSRTSNFFPFSIRRSGSAHSSLTNRNSETPNNSSSTFSLLSSLTSRFSYLSSTFNLLTSPDNNEIDQENVARLMGAVCFGYGVLQLGLSLLPPSILRVTNFLGFYGNRTAAISNLMYARKCTDLRAPLATLALLWYHTIVRPFYGLDGSNVKAGVEAANLLVEESQAEYGESALFLFFKGRIYRLDSNIPMALESFQSAANNSAQREIKLLALHEVGWCHVIQLDYVQAYKVFSRLKVGSRWSKTFYSYLLVICSGSSGRRVLSEIDELRNYYSHTTRTNQLETYIRRRLIFFPTYEEELINTHNNFWKMFVYELLYMWNALPSCSYTCIDTIIQECNEGMYESMPGLAKLIQGECYNFLGQYENAVDSLRECIYIRSAITPEDDVHISAYAEYALGVLLVRNTATKEEGKALLEHSNQYKDYDFANKLHVRINMALKNVS